MGFKKPIERNSITMAILKTHGEICSPYNDGYVSWGMKQELYEIKFLLDEILKREPTFAGEAEWLEEQSKKQMWSELKR